jgi:hypothetical protein
MFSVSFPLRASTVALPAPAAGVTLLWVRVTMARKSTDGDGEREIQNGKKKRKVRGDFGREKCVEKDFQAKVTELESVDEGGV